MSKKKNALSPLVFYLYRCDALRCVALFDFSLLFRDVLQKYTSPKWVSKAFWYIYTFRIAIRRSHATELDSRIK